jgi:hypothetical protein
MNRRVRAIRAVALGSVILTLWLASPGWGQAPARSPPLPPAKPHNETTPTEPADANVDLAYGAYQRGLFLTAFSLATRAVEERGDVKAMALLGVLYSEGFGVPRDDAKAAQWFTLAAGRGDREAMFALAHLRMTDRPGRSGRSGGGRETLRVGGQARPRRSGL